MKNVGNDKEESSLFCSEKATKGIPFSALNMFTLHLDAAYNFLPQGFRRNNIVKTFPFP